MDAGSCASCQSPLGEIDTSGMLGLFPRVRCGACGLVNVMTGSISDGIPDVPAGTSVAISTEFAVTEYVEELESDPSFSIEPEPTNIGIGIDDNFEPEPTRVGEDIEFQDPEPTRVGIQNPTDEGDDF
jgi:hypothetical protein